MSEQRGPKWSGANLINLLLRLAEAAKDKNGKAIIDGQELLDLWEENRVRLLIAHDVPFSIECAGGECQDCGSGDGIGSLDEARELGWTGIEVAPAECPTSHFFGLCPACLKARQAEEAEASEVTP